jgi:hypothetical protein
VATYSSRTVGLAIESEIIRHGLAGEIERRGIPHKRLNVTEASTWVLIEPSQRVAVVDFTELVAKYNPDPNIRLIGACYAPEMDDYLRCLSAGGVGIIDVGMTFDSALRVIDGAFDNDSVLPRDVLKVIAQRAVREPFESLGQLQRQLLVGLCSGMTIGCMPSEINRILGAPCTRSLGQPLPGDRCQEPLRGNPVDCPERYPDNLRPGLSQRSRHERIVIVDEFFVYRSLT